MRHRVAGRKLGRKTEHRIATLRNLSTALIKHERIRTTLMKAKEMRPFTEHLITLSKRDTLAARRRVARDIRDHEAVKKLFSTLAARYASRLGGYTRLYHLDPRPGDGSDMALVELVDAETVATKASAAGKTGGKEAPPSNRRSRAKRREKTSAGPVGGAGGAGADARE